MKSNKGCFLASNKLLVFYQFIIIKLIIITFFAQPLQAQISDEAHQIRHRSKVYFENDRKKLIIVLSDRLDFNQKLEFHEMIPGTIKGFYSCVENVPTQTLLDHKELSMEAITELSDDGRHTFSYEYKDKLCTRKLRAIDVFISKYGKKIRIDLDSPQRTYHNTSYDLRKMITTKGATLRLRLTFNDLDLVEAHTVHDGKRFPLSFSVDHGVWAEAPFFAKRTENHAVSIIDKAVASFKLRLDMIERAKSSIDFMTYIYDNDEAGRIFAQALVKKAKEGVRVRVLIDRNPFGFKMTREYTSAMEKAGVDVKLYNSTFFLSPTQSRLHQKILLIDGKEVLLGGRNIKNDYFGLNAESLYQDRDIWIYGPIGFNIKWAFESYFFHKDSYRPANFINIQAPVTQNKLDSLSAKERIKVEKRLRQSEKFLLETTELIFIKNKIQEIGERQLAASPVVMTKDLEFVADRPGKNKSSRVIGHALFRSIENTEEEVLLEAPYFIMLSEGKRMVKALLEDDIPFTLMTNSRYSIGKSSIPIAYVIEHLGKQHVRDGMTIYGYSGNSLDLQDVVIPLEPKGRSELHGKSAVIGKMSYVGTYNMDPRSKDYNAELGIIFRNTPEIVDLLKISYEQIINNSMLLAPDGGYVASELYDEVKRRRGDSDNVIENIKFFFVNALFKKII